MNELKAMVSPYLGFGGSCREAMEFYKNALDGKLEIMSFKDAPMDYDKSMEDRVMHARLEFNGGVVMGSDNGRPDQKVVQGNNIHLSIAVNDEATGKKYFDNLSDGANVAMPWGDTFWGAMFGMLTDKFGIQWMVSYEKGEKAFDV